MTGSGEAAEQVIRIAIDGAEFALRIAGSASKEIAAFLLAAVQSGNKNPKIRLKGKERLKRLLQSGKELKIYAVKESDLKKFTQEAKKYGVAYCAKRDRRGHGDGTVDIMAKAEDASKIQRIMDKLEFATVDKASIKSEVTKTKQEVKAEKQSAKKKMRDEKAQAKKVYKSEVKAARQKAKEEFRSKRGEAKQTQRGSNKSALEQYRSDIGKKSKTRKEKEPSTVVLLLKELAKEVIQLLPFVRRRAETAKPESEIPAPELSTPDQNDPDALLNELLPSNEGKAKDGKTKEVAIQNLSLAMTEKSSPSPPTSKSAAETTKVSSERPESVPGFLRESAARKKSEAAEAGRQDVSQKGKNARQKESPAPNPPKRSKKKKSRGGR